MAGIPLQRAPFPLLLVHRLVIRRRLLVLEEKEESVWSLGVGFDNKAPPRIERKSW